MRKRILALADDLTGALEVGAKFGNAVVTVRRNFSFDGEVPDVLVIDTETRHLGPDEAASVVRETLVHARVFGPWLIYKKTDSTLRGNIAAELRALRSVFPERPLVYAPAYPELGRTVRGGHLFVHGVPVHLTAFANDPLNPVRSSSVLELLEGIAATVLDGESASDLEAAAREIVGRYPPPLAAGPAALAGYLGQWPVSEAPPVAARALIVNGSLHPASASQIEFGRVNGILDGAWITCDRDPFTVRRALSESRYNALIVFGGDTAFEIHKALGARDFRTCGEVVPGVPVSRSGDLIWITKAGGFGGPELLRELRNKLT
jgi:uncharacterized protein YgbK (DUF1537 family)